VIGTVVLGNFDGSIELGGFFPGSDMLDALTNRTSRDSRLHCFRAARTWRWSKPRAAFQLLSLFFRFGRNASCAIKHITLFKTKIKQKGTSFAIPVTALFKLENYLLCKGG